MRTLSSNRVLLSGVGIAAIALASLSDAEAGRRRRCCPRPARGCVAPACCCVVLPNCASPGAVAPAHAAPADAAPSEAAPQEYAPPTEPPADAPEPPVEAPAPAATPAESAAAPAAEAQEAEWVTLNNGENFDGWKINENPDSWRIEDGAFVAQGERSHLFFVADETPFENFELKVDCLTKPNSNGGIYFHTRFQERGWPRYGHEAQVNNSYANDPKKSGSLYGVVDVLEQHIPDDEWWTETITVRGGHITIMLNDKVVVDYEEPADKPAFSNDFERRRGSGTFALQAHDPGSTVYYKNIRVRRLP
ncbi:MAG: DUF1080 domain-containing protein [Planctomyces sp.]|nr:DUF1080 domain-containing protein [Planctomyces sp.]